MHIVSILRKEVEQLLPILPTLLTIVLFAVFDCIGVYHLFLENKQFAVGTKHISIVISVFVSAEVMDFTRFQGFFQYSFERPLYEQLFPHLLI